MLPIFFALNIYVRFELVLGRNATYEVSNPHSKVFHDWQYDHGRKGSTQAPRCDRPERMWEVLIGNAESIINLECSTCNRCCIEANNERPIVRCQAQNSTDFVRYRDYSSSCDTLILRWGRSL